MPNTQEPSTIPNDGAESNIGGFITKLAKYYSDFLSTDFKKGRLPKRRFQTKDAKGRRSGIPLEKYPTFLPSLRKLLSRNFSQSESSIVKLGSHKSRLNSVTYNAIYSAIEKFNLGNL